MPDKQPSPEAMRAAEEIDKIWGKEHGFFAYDYEKAQAATIIDREMEPEDG